MVIKKRQIDTGIGQKIGILMDRTDQNKGDFQRRYYVGIASVFGRCGAPTNKNGPTDQMIHRAVKRGILKPWA
jgi:hypothetical protein